MFALSILFALLLLTLVPVAYALGAQKVAFRFSRAALPAFLVAFSFALSLLGAWRIGSVTPTTASYRPFDTNPVWMVSLYASVLIVALLPTTLRVAKLSTAETQMYRGWHSFREVPWFLLGLLIAVIILLALDIAGVPFLPAAVPPMPPEGAV